MEDKASLEGDNIITWLQIRRLGTRLEGLNFDARLEGFAPDWIGITMHQM